MTSHIQKLKWRWRPEVIFFPWLLTTIHNHLPERILLRHYIIIMTTVKRKGGWSPAEGEGSGQGWTRPKKNKQTLINLALGV